MAVWGYVLKRLLMMMVNITGNIHSNTKNVPQV